jgi:hypothetical protein
MAGAPQGAQERRRRLLEWQKINPEQVLRMRSFDFIMIGAALLGLGSVGCGQPVSGACQRAIGVYHGRYSFLTGTCEPTLQGRALVLEKDDLQSTIKKQTTLSDVVTTEINLIGCMIGMRQDITDTGQQRMKSSLKGDLEVGQDDSLSGQISRVEYMPDGSTVRCTGTYNALYTRDGAIIGSAAEHALASH